MTIAFTNLRAPLTEPPRLSTGLSQFDYALDGGIVCGTTALLCGDPGAGKSTLLIQAAGAVAQREGAGSVVYLSSEESAEQIQYRARRLKLEDNPVMLAATSNIRLALTELAAAPPKLLIIDSIQSMQDTTRGGNPGGKTQCKLVIDLLRKFAHQHSTAIIIVCHVTKDGRMAGPKELEHDVDVAMRFEAIPADDGNKICAIRAFKNRYGRLYLAGLFSMTQRGLSPIQK